MSTPEFSARDPLSPEFWDERFARGFTPWDKGGVPQALQDFARAQPPQRALIPGCGAGHELDFLSELGWDAVAIDFAAEAVAAARRRSPRWATRFEQADFFDYQPSAPLDLIYERAFLCALPRSMWPQVAARWAELLAPGKLLAGFFYFGTEPKGPPFAADPAQQEALLTPNFERITDAPVVDSLPVFAGGERWQIWRRR